MSGRLGKNLKMLVNNKLTMNRTPGIAKGKKRMIKIRRKKR